MSTIKISLSKGSIEKALKELERYKKELPRKARLLAQRIAELGGNVARNGFSMPLDYIGENDITVEVVEQDTLFVILAKGKAVCFVEFGAGVTAGSGYDIPVDLDISPGSWSKNHAQEFSRYGFWTYGGQKITQSTPAKAMYNASKEIRTQLLKVAKEVLNG